MLMEVNMNSLKKYFDLLLVMTDKEIKARYKRAVFGFLWVVLNPLFQMLIIGLVFSYFIKIPNYFLFLFTGLLPWEFFSLSLNKATSSIVYERSLLKKAKFPREIIPISIILANFFHLLISLILLLIWLILAGRLAVIRFDWLLIAILWLLIFTIGLSLLTSSLQVKFRDISFLMKALLNLWFYATPVMYSLKLVPIGLRQWFKYNPLATVIELIHGALLGQSLMTANLVLPNLGLSILIVILGVWIFKKKDKFFNDWL